MTQMTVLQPGDPFPSLTVALPGGRTLRLPDSLAGRFGVVLYYRGSWCPYCNAQLSAFQRSLDSLAGLVIVSVYSSGAIGRLIPQDVAGLAGYLREHPRPARSRRYGNSDPR